MEAEIKRLQQKQKAEERNVRTHRICTRGGMIEGMLPETISLTDDEFRTFLEKTTANSFGRKILGEILGSKTDEVSGTGGSGNTAKLKTPPAAPSQQTSPKAMPQPQNSATSDSANRQGAVDQAG